MCVLCSFVLHLHSPITSLHSINTLKTITRTHYRKLCWFSISSTNRLAITTKADESWPTFEYFLQLFCILFLSFVYRRSFALAATAAAPQCHFNKVVRLHFLLPYLRIWRRPECISVCVCARQCYCYCNLLSIDPHHNNRCRRWRQLKLSMPAVPKKKKIQ